MIDIEKVNKYLNNMMDEYNELLDKYKLSGGFGNWYGGVKKALTELDRLQKREIPPTSDDVCRALSEHLKFDVRYDGLSKIFKGIDGMWLIKLHENDVITINTHLKFNHITLIGRFYENEVKGE